MWGGGGKVWEEVWDEMVDRRMGGVHVGVDGWVGGRVSITHAHQLQYLAVCGLSGKSSSKCLNCISRQHQVTYQGGIRITPGQNQDIIRVSSGYHQGTYCIPLSREIRLTTSASLFIKETLYSIKLYNNRLKIPLRGRVPRPK